MIIEPDEIASHPSRINLEGQFASSMDGWERKQGSIKVAVTDVHMPFWSMVVFMIKWAIAAIPAFIILAFIFFGLSAFFAGFFGAFR